MMFRSLQMDWMELKHPFQSAIQVREKEPIMVPSMVTNMVSRMTMATRPATSADMGRNFQSF